VFVVIGLDTLGSLSSNLVGALLFLLERRNMLIAGRFSCQIFSDCVYKFSLQPPAAATFDEKEDFSFPLQ
jgi:hypothetical protein